jgi:hypothetical protein
MKKLFAVLVLAPLLLAAGTHSNKMLGLTNKSGHTLEIELRYGIKTVWQKTTTASLKDGQSRQWPYMDGEASIFFVRARDESDPRFYCQMSRLLAANYEIGVHRTLDICTFKLLGRAR